MESSETAADTPQKRPEKLKIGSTITLKPNKPVLIGRAPVPVPGYDVFRVEGLKKNPRISNYGVEVIMESRGNIDVRRPVLWIGGGEYVSSNDIVVTDLYHKKVPIENSLFQETGEKGIIFEEIYVGDQENNGFILLPVGDNLIQLVEINDNGRVSKMKIGKY